MTFEEAKAQLDACTLRPGDADEAARVLALSDAELKAWLEKRTEYDERCATCFIEDEVPSALRDRLVAAMDAEAPASAVRRKPMVFRTVVPWLAVATAAAIVVLGIFGPWWHGAGSDPWEREALALVTRIEEGRLPLDQHSGDLEELKSGLTLAKSPAPEVLPQRLASLRSHGCKMIKVGGRAASVICFQISPGKEAHLVVIDNAGLKKIPSKHQPQFNQRGVWQVASWSDEAHTYLLATHADEKALKRLFGLAALWTDCFHNTA